ncbi:MAG TPA: disulfide bond formation protein B [Pseudolabrys sp.]|nr:disulfide bond formation protein B [Pseudolabrys sp.]
MSFSISKPEPATAAALVAAIGALTIATVYVFQYGLGYQPCPLCYEQRDAYYVSIPLAVLLWLGVNYGASRKVLLLGFAVIALAFLWNMGLASYHAGVEWHWWAGPSDCSGGLGKLGNAGGLLKQLNKVVTARCDEAAWRFLGISMAGYDVLISLALAVIALWGLRGAMLRKEEA